MHILDLTSCPNRIFVANIEMQFSKVYEVNLWLWQFGLGRPRLGGLSCEETDERKEAALQERSLQAAETSRHCKADLA